MLDYRMSYKNHFKYIIEKVGKINRALCKLMPNLRGPSENKRKLYGSVVQSVVMYAAPIWSRRLNKSKAIQRSLKNIQRTLAIRIIAGYRTISTEMALMLARLPPWHLAEKYHNIYTRIAEAKKIGPWTVQAIKDIRQKEEDRMHLKWKGPLTDCCHTRDAREAIGNNLLVGL